MTQLVVAKRSVVTVGGLPRILRPGDVIDSRFDNLAALVVAGVSFEPSTGLATFQTSPYQAFPSDTLVEADPSGGAVVVRMEALPAAKTRRTVKSIASGSSVSVQGVGFLVEDPNAASSYQATVSIPAAAGSASTWEFDGTRRQFVSSNATGSGGGGGGAVTPTRVSASGTLSASASLVYANSSGAPLSLTMAGTGLTDGKPVTIVDDRVSWDRNNVSLFANTGQQIEDVANPGTFRAAGVAVLLVAKGGAYTWQWDATDGRWKLV